MNIKKSYKSIKNVAGDAIPVPAICGVATFIRYSEMRNNKPPQLGVAGIVGETFGFHAMLSQDRPESITFSGDEAVEIYWNGVEYRCSDPEAMIPSITREVTVTPPSPQNDTPPFMTDLPVELD